MRSIVRVVSGGAQAVVQRHSLEARPILETLFPSNLILLAAMVDGRWCRDCCRRCPVADSEYLKSMGAQTLAQVKRQYGPRILPKTHPVIPKISKTSSCSPGIPTSDVGH